MNVEQSSIEPPQAVAEQHDGDQALARIAAALRGLTFGTVTAVVHNGVVVQVERTEKVRLQR